MKLSAIAILSAVCVAGLSACGGGGGSPGETHAPYQITLRAERTQLPLNVGSAGPGIGVSAPYTTTIYVQATDGGKPIPGGEDGVFGCNTAYGLSSGPLYYLDGKDEHEHDVELPDGTTVKVPSAYRSITLGSNAGGNSFHFHAGDQAGTATITCSVTDPRDKSQASASIDIVVGGATGKAARVNAIAQNPVLGTQGNLNNAATSTVVQAQVFDDANQPVNGANLQVEIVDGAAGSSGARLLAGAQSGNVVRVATTGGVGTFSLSSGTTEGTVLLRLTTDRADGDVANGIADAISQLLVVPVSDQVATAPPEIVAATLPEAPYGMSYAYALSATGGVAPYTWSALGGLPTGLRLGADGLLSGTPSGDKGGTVNFVVRVTDARGKTASANMAVTVGDPPPPPAPVAPALAIGGCSGATCTLPAAPAGTAYGYTLWTTGGSGTAATWTLVGLVPSGFTINGGSGRLAWAAPACPAAPAGANPGQTVTVSVTKGSDTLVQAVKIPVTQADGSACP